MFQMTAKNHPRGSTSLTKKGRFKPILANSPKTVQSKHISNLTTVISLTSGFSKRPQKSK